MTKRYEIDWNEILTRLHKQGKSHNRMMCPVCREARLHPKRMTTGEPWKG